MVVWDVCPITYQNINDKREKWESIHHLQGIREEVEVRRKQRQKKGREEEGMKF